RESKNPPAQFVWSLMRDNFHDAAVKLAEIADNARAVDLAMRFGFGSDQGPFEIWQQAGWGQVAEWIREDIDAGRALAKVPLPSWVFAGKVAEGGGVHQPEGSYSPASDSFVARAAHPVYRRQVFPASVAGEKASDARTAGETVGEDAPTRLWTLDRCGL